MARLLSRQTDIFPGEYEKMLGEMLARRLAGEPLQYILGEWELMGLPFRVDARALIPRQDTETLVEAALGLIKERGYRTVLDLCCGTGCIGISLAALSGAAVTLADISADALALARENAEKNGVCARVTETNLFSNIKRSFDLIACNPPYLSDADMAALQREVRFEPALALYGGADGLDFYRRIRTEYAAHLNPGGALLLEVGFGQAAAVMRCAISVAWNGWWPYAEAPAYARCAARLPSAVRMCCGNARAPHDHACTGGFRTSAASGKDPDAYGNACAGTFAFSHAFARAADGDDWLSGRHPHHADAGAKREAGGWNV